MRLSLGPSLAKIKAEAMAQIDAEAESARVRFITPGAGQAMEYQETSAEAAAYMAASQAERDARPWPWLAAERNARGGTITLLDVAQEVLTMRAAWVQVGSTIKELRRAAKVAVEAATTVAEVRAAATVPWPTP